jgi:hypothetical protein
MRRDLESCTRATAGSQRRHSASPKSGIYLLKSCFVSQCSHSKLGASSWLPCARTRKQSRNRRFCFRLERLRFT